MPLCAPMIGTLVHFTPCRWKRGYTASRNVWLNASQLPVSGNRSERHRHKRWRNRRNLFRSGPRRGTYWLCVTYSLGLESRLPKRGSKNSSFKFHIWVLCKDTELGIRAENIWQDHGDKKNPRRWERNFINLVCFKLKNSQTDEEEQLWNHKQTRQIQLCMKWWLFSWYNRCLASNGSQPKEVIAQVAKWNMKVKGFNAMERKTWEAPFDSPLKSWSNLTRRHLLNHEFRPMFINIFHWLRKEGLFRSIWISPESAMQGVVRNNKALFRW